MRSSLDSLRRLAGKLGRSAVSLTMLARAVTRDPIRLGRRALNLLFSNPRLFAVRVSMLFGRLVRDPGSSITILIAMRRRRLEIERGYQLWLANRDGDAVPAAGTTTGPLLSVIMPVYNTDERLLEEAIASVRRQSYSQWELCIADDASTKLSIRPLLKQFARRDSRIRVTFRAQPGHISAASNSAIDLSGGEFLVFLDHDDLLAPTALARIAAVIAAQPRVDFIYSDEDKIDDEGRRCQPFFKPAWSPTLLTTCNYITHLAAIRRSLVLDVGGFRDEMVGSQDHDLFLRVAERARVVAHIPDVLYSWRMTHGSTANASLAKPYAVGAARRALEDTVQRRALPATVEESHLNGIFILRHPLRQPPPVSLVVIGDGSAWERLLDFDEITVNDIVFLDQPRRTMARLTVVPDIDALSGDYLVWLDARSEPAGAESVTGLLEYAQFEQIAVVGGATRQRDGTVLQAGITIGPGGQPFYAYAGLPLLPQPNFYLNLKDLPREVSAVYSGCCAMRRETWRLLGGWDRRLPPVLAMCDLCLRANEQGLSTVYSLLARFERPSALEPIPAVDGLQWNWRAFDDPFWNPNMNPARPDGLPFQWDGKVRERAQTGAANPAEPRT